MTTTATDHPLADLAIRSVEHALRDHQPGQPYRLGPVDAAYFLANCFGLANLYPSRVIDDPADDGWCEESFRNFIVDMWADIAAYEAKRTFEPSLPRSASTLAMVSSGYMVWEYTTTAGIKIRLRTDRECVEPHKATECAIQIPAERDQHGHHTWAQVRIAMARCSPRSVFQSIVKAHFKQAHEA